jgi:hypothetical protein
MRTTAQIDRLWPVLSGCFLTIALHDHLALALRKLPLEYWKGNVLAKKQSQHEVTTILLQLII